MMPDLIVLGVVLDDVGDVRELDLKIFVQLLENLAAILPDGVIRGVESESVCGEFEGAFRLFLRR